MRKGAIVCKRLQPQIAQPKPPVALGPVLKHILHTFGQSAQSHPVDIPFPLGIAAKFNLFGGARDRPCRKRVYDEGVLRRNGYNFHLYIAEGIAPWQRQSAGENVEVNCLLLKPAAAYPTAVVRRILLNIAQRFAECNLYERGGVGMAAMRGKTYGDIPHIVIAEVEHLTLPFL